MIPLHCDAWRACHAILTAFVLTALVAGSAQGSLIKEFSFDVDGVLPSADPDLDFFTNSSMQETELYAVEGGLLQQRTFGTGLGNSSYLSNENIVLDPSLDVIMEARLRVLRFEGDPPVGHGGAYFQILDGSHRYSLWLADTWVQVDGGSVLEVDTSEMHTYRLESPGGSTDVRLFIDGNLASTTTAPEHSANTFGFGDGVTDDGNNADVDWDYIYIANGAGTAIPPDDGLRPPAVLNNPTPNPFNPRTTIAFSLASPGWAEISIHDLAGRRVASLGADRFAAGEHSLVWNGRDARGRAVPSGIYFARLQTASGVQARKMALIE